MNTREEKISFAYELNIITYSILWIFLYIFTYHVHSIRSCAFEFCYKCIKTVIMLIVTRNPVINIYFQ